MAVTVRTVPAASVICRRQSPPLAAARAAVTAFAEELARRGVEAVAPPFLLATDTAFYEMCVPVRPGTTTPDTVGFGLKAFGPMTVASVTVPGPHPETTVTRLLDWLAENSGYRVAGPVVELYPLGSDRTEVGIVVAPAEP